MGSKWRKVKMALGLSMCVYVPRDHVAGNEREDDSSPASLPPYERRSDATLLPPPEDDCTSALPAPGSSKLRLSKSLSRSSSKSTRTCSICLESMKRPNQAIFTAECSHAFHFRCIVSNVKHGNQICPICRAKWKEIPVQGPNPDPPTVRAPRISPVDWPRNNDMMRVNHQLTPRRLNSIRHVSPLFQAPEPAVFNDDESLDSGTPSTEERNHPYQSSGSCDHRQKVTLKTDSEVSSIPQSKSVDSFTTLLHLKAPSSDLWHKFGRNNVKFPQISQTPRVPVDLVTVLDISGSMAGTKLALLKRAMGFVIQNLGPYDRLCVVAFSSTARRFFPLRRMSQPGKHLSLQAVNSLVAGGGTNIAEGLRKGANVMEDRREKNPVSSIILLSDGKDTYTVNRFSGILNQPNHGSLLPLPIHPEESPKIPIHAFGFGSDHDASSMHSISELSGGTFSFIETVGVIQDAFARCIGGLLSVVVKNLRISIECVHPAVRLVSVTTGSYPSHVFPNRCIGSIDVGDLYADEERDFLVSVNVPSEVSDSETSLLKIRCVYYDPLAKDTVTLDDEEVRIKRTEVAGKEKISIEVDRQQNRFRAADAMARAQNAAEAGDLAGAISLLENCRKLLSESVSAKCRDSLCITLDAELKEMQERMTSRHVYVESGRAYILSGLSSHSWQRATTRGGSSDGSSPQAYQTPSMLEMVTRSQASLVGSGSTQRQL